MKRCIVILSLLLSLSAFAQEPDNVRLSVQNCIELALENNIELKNSQLRSRPRYVPNARVHSRFVRAARRAPSRARLRLNPPMANGKR